MIPQKSLYALVNLDDEARVRLLTKVKKGEYTFSEVVSLFFNDLFAIFCFLG